MPDEQLFALPQAAQAALGIVLTLILAGAWTISEDLLTDDDQPTEE